MKRLIHSPDAKTAVLRRTETPPWTFLSNHSHVLICLAREPEARLRDVAEYVGITERAVQKIVRELELGGVISRFRQGRCNRYIVHLQRSLRHPVENHCTVWQLLSMSLSPREFKRLTNSVR
jgi:DNA-binding Lrp family transcriptional regulator